MARTQTSLGLGKVKYSSSAALVSYHGEAIDYDHLELILSERLLRKKSTGAWPKAALKKMGLPKADSMVENRDVEHPQLYEQQLNKLLPFLESLKQEELDYYSSITNPEVQFITHHLAHAYLAKFFSPYDQSLILVIDGAGSRASDFTDDHPERNLIEGITRDHLEERSLYLLDTGELQILEKRWQTFEKKDGRSLSSGLGIFYETIAEYIFKSNQAAGKVMGLAAFGKAKKIVSSLDFLRQLDWRRSYTGADKTSWENSQYQEEYKNLAATAQKYFEDNLLTYLEEIKMKYKSVKNLILVGGCALNCTTNAKIIERKIFDSVYIPPCPGDGGISLGCALSVMKKHQKLPPNHQHPYWGSTQSQPERFDIVELFSAYDVQKISLDNEEIYKRLADGEVVAWFQGRSECGPRALGHRSLLAALNRKDLKDYLNAQIKFREAFRPYGCSVTFECKEKYFEVASDFENPFMSFATRIKEEFKDFLLPVTHVDGTSRMQTVRQEQSPEFYELLKRWGEYSGHPVLLNTSLNIMGEPIVETPIDALRFFESSKVRTLIIGEYLVTKR